MRLEGCRDTHLLISSLNTPPVPAVTSCCLGAPVVAQIFSEWSSLLTLAWSVSSFVRATRLTEPSLPNLSTLDQVLLTLGHFCSITSQVSQLARWWAIRVVAAASPFTISLESGVGLICESLPFVFVPSVTPCLAI